MTTWEEIRDEVAGMLADGKPLEDVIGKLEQRKNEMAKANLIAVMDEMKKPKPMTNEDWFCGLSTEEKAKFIFWQHFDVYGKTLYGLMVDASRGVSRDKQAEVMIGAVVEWLKQPHREE